MNENYLDSTGNYSQLYDQDVSLFALNVANEVCGLTVERYNQHFLPGKTLVYMTEMGNPVLPELNPLDTKDWKITCEPEDEDNYNSYLNNLMDRNLKTSWQPEYALISRSHEISIDMKTTRMVRGVKITQKDFDPATDQTSQNLLPGVIKIKALTENLDEKEVNYVEENTLGATAGEATIINFHMAQDVRYLKFIVSDQPYGNNFTVTLAEIEVF